MPSSKSPFIALVLVASIILGLVLSAAAWIKASNRRDDFWLNVGSAGVQLLVIVLVGACISALLRKWDLDREERQRRVERRLQMFNNVVAAYNELKAVRRNLRSLALLGGDPLNSERVAELRGQMKQLNKTQLSFEAIKREISADTVTFPDDGSLACQLLVVDQFLHQFIKLWEEHGGAVWSGVDGAKIHALELQTLIGDKQLGFEPKVMVPMRQIRRALRFQILRYDTLEPEDT